MTPLNSHSFKNNWAPFFMEIGNRKNPKYQPGTTFRFTHRGSWAPKIESAQMKYSYRGK